MENIKKIFSSLSILINFAVLALWICIFNTSAGHDERVERFNAFFPVSASILSAILIISSIISIMVFAQSKSRVAKAAIVVQSAFVALYVFQYL